MAPAAGPVAGGGAPEDDIGLIQLKSRKEIELIARGGKENPSDPTFVNELLSLHDDAKDVRWGVGGLSPVCR